MSVTTEPLIKLENDANVYEESQKERQANVDAKQFLAAVANSHYANVEGVLKKSNDNNVGIPKRKKVAAEALQLAAERNDFYMVKLLFNYEVDPIKRKEDKDLNRLILKERIRMYRAISSPAYISIFRSHIKKKECTSKLVCYRSAKDCVQEAFDLCQEMAEFLRQENVYILKEEHYIVAEAIELLKAFSIDLLNCCRTDGEVRGFLAGGSLSHQCCGFTAFPHVDILETLFGDSYKVPLMPKRYIIADKAIQTNQLEFIAQYRCQDFLKDEWLRGQPDWSKKKGFLWSVLYCVFAVFVYGILSQLLPVFLFFKKIPRLQSLFRSPKSVFIGHFLSYSFFLCFIFTYQVMVSYKIEGSDIVIESKGNHMPVLILCMTWFVILSYEELSKFLVHGPTHYFRNKWNLLDLIILLSFFIGVIIANPAIVTPPYNDPYISIYLSKFTSLTFVFALLRLIEPFYLSDFIGPILLIFTEMKHDIFRFLTVFTYVVTAYAMAMYYVYVGMAVDENPSEFARFPTSLSSLVITIFGGDASESLIVLGPEVSNFTNDVSSAGKGPDYAYFTVVGYILYIMFGTITLIMLLNLCIAMMSDRYTKLQAEINQLWKLKRSRIWLEYISGDRSNLNVLSLSVSILLLIYIVIVVFFECLCCFPCICCILFRSNKVSESDSNDTTLDVVVTDTEVSRRRERNEVEVASFAEAAARLEREEKNKVEEASVAQAAAGSEGNEENKVEPSGVSSNAEVFERNEKNQVKVISVAQAAAGSEVNGENKVEPSTVSSNAAVFERIDENKVEVASVGQAAAGSEGNEENKVEVAGMAQPAAASEGNKENKVEVASVGQAAAGSEGNEENKVGSSRVASNAAVLEKNEEARVPEFEKLLDILLSRYFKKFARPLENVNDEHLITPPIVPGGSVEDRATTLPALPLQQPTKSSLSTARSARRTSTPERIPPKQNEKTSISNLHDSYFESDDGKLWNLVKVSGKDLKCFYRCCVLAMNDYDDMQESTLEDKVSQFQQDLASFIERENETKYRGNFGLNVFCSDGGFDSFKARANHLRSSEPHVAGNVEIICASKMLSRPILIFQKRQFSKNVVDNKHIALNLDTSICLPDVKCNSINILYRYFGEDDGANHFDLLQECGIPSP